MGLTRFRAHPLCRFFDGRSVVRLGARTRSFVARSVGCSPGSIARSLAWSLGRSNITGHENQTQLGTAQVNRQYAPTGIDYCNQDRLPAGGQLNAISILCVSTSSRNRYLFPYTYDPPTQQSRSFRRHLLKARRKGWVVGGWGVGCGRVGCGRWEVEGGRWVADTKKLKYVPHKSYNTK